MLFLGGALVYTGARNDWPQPNPPAEVVHSFTVTIQAQPNVNWTLWLPRPTMDTTLETDDVVLAVGWVETPHGRLEAVSGKGTVVLFYANRSSVPAGEYDPPLSFELSGGDFRTGYWVMRQSSDPSAEIRVVATGRTESAHPRESWSCGGPGYHGDVSEGWTLVPSGGGWDCVVGISVRGAPPWVVPSAWAMLAVGVVVVALAFALRMRPRARMEPSEIVTERR